MAEQRENSVLFSLRELQQIEEERVSEEESARRTAEEARIRAQMEAERKKREEEEALRAAQEQSERETREAEERRRREEELRLQETEARARVEAQAQLEQQRLHQEMELRRVEASKKRPTGLIAVAVILILAVGGLAWFLITSQAESEAEIAKRETALKAQQQKTEQLASALAASEKEMEKISAEMKEITQIIISEEKSADEKQRAKARLADLENRSKRVKRRTKKLRAASKKKGTINLSTKCITDPNADC